MRKIIYCCDRCGKEIAGKVFICEISSIIREEDGNLESEQEFDAEMVDKHFCRTCASWIVGCTKPPVKAEAKVEAVKNKGGKNGSVQLDDGKIYALKQAGWSLAKIKEELRADVSDQTILNHYNKYAAEIGGTE